MWVASGGGELQSVKIDNVRLFPPAFLEAHVANLVAESSLS